MKYRRGFPTGMTLVEILVVIAIIATLIGLLLPAVQAARESARRVQCGNHIRQFATAWTAHHASHGHFPGGGWGWEWVGDPDRGFGRGQPGAWIFSILPYIEQEPLWSMAAGISDTATKRQKLTEMCQTPLPILHCPSRRPAKLTLAKGHWAPPNANRVREVAKTDYAANCGSSGHVDWVHPANTANGESEQWWAANGEPLFQKLNGVSGSGALINSAHITDGLSNTYLVGEKHLNPDCYDGVIAYSRYDAGDNEVAYAGWNRDFYRSSRYGTPRRDTPALSAHTIFGSGHPLSINMAFADGSLRSVPYDVDPDVHRRLASRNDREIASPDDL